jgi:hypothetical protein
VGKLRMILAMMTVGNLFQHYPKLYQILRESSGSKNWLGLTAISNKPSR